MRKRPGNEVKIFLKIGWPDNGDLAGKWRSHSFWSNHGFTRRGYFQKVSTMVKYQLKYITSLCILF